MMVNLNSFLRTPMSLFLREHKMSHDHGENHWGVNSFQEHLNI